MFERYYANLQSGLRKYIERFRGLWHKIRNSKLNFCIPWAFPTEYIVQPMSADLQVESPRATRCAAGKWSEPSKLSRLSFHSFTTLTRSCWQLETFPAPIICRKINEDILLQDSAWKLLSGGWYWQGHTAFIIQQFASQMARTVSYHWKIKTCKYLVKRWRSDLIYRIFHVNMLAR